MVYLYWLVILGAPVVSLSFAADGTWSYGWPLYAALAAQAAAAAGLLRGGRTGAAAAAAAVMAGHFMFYNSACGLGEKSAHYRNISGLNALREGVELRRRAGGNWPADLSSLEVPVLAVKNGHRRTRAVNLVSLPFEAYRLAVPAEGEWREVKGRARGPGGADIEFAYDAEVAGSPRHALLPPGGEYSYELYGSRETPLGAGPMLLLSSGTVRVPQAPGYDADSGAWAYDPSSGHVFIGCTHKPEYKDDWEWRSL